MELTNGPVSQPFGANPQFAWQLGYGHLGIDWAVGEGTPCVAIADGTVLWADWGQNMPADQCNENMLIFKSPNSGIMVLVQHDGWRCLYAHGSRTDLNVGNKVKRGQTVMLSGTTGNSTGPHLHGESLLAPSPGVPPYGRYNLRAQIELEDKLAAARMLQPNQRRVGTANVLQRAKAHRSGAEVRLVKANTVETFTGYVIGELVDLGGVRSNIWYKDAKGFVWAGGFTTQELRGLPNQTPPPPAAKPAALLPNQRRAGKAGAIQRAEPRSKATEVRRIAGGTVENFSHWITGESITLGGVTSDVWYKDSLGYVWAGAFEQQSTTGLVHFALPIAQPAPPIVIVKPPEPGKVVVGPKELTAELPSVTEVHPASVKKYNAGNKTWPILDVYVHQFATATPEEDAVTNRFTVRLQSLINTFTSDDFREASCHIGIEGKRVAQFVSLRDRAWHAGSVGNDGIGIEVYGAMDAETLATLNTVLVDLSKLAGGELRLHRHGDVMATACGRHVPLEQIASTLAASLAPAPSPAPSPAPGPKVTDDALLAATAELSAAVTQYITERK